MNLGGIHHVSAICGDPQRNIDFWAGLLGLRLVKKTVNFDDPTSYHLYYGDGLGTPGTLMTFFAWTAVPPLAFAQGRQGVGQITTTSFSVPAGSLGYWIDRLADAAVDFDGPESRMGERVLALRDPDGLPIELVAHDTQRARAEWRRSDVPAEHAIRGLHGVALCLLGYEKTAALLTEVLGMRYVTNEGSRFRFAAGDDAGVVDLTVQAEASPGRMGIGVVHHLAWRTASADQQEAWRRALVDAGYDVTPILDRKYFQSIYFREPNDVVFEIATDGPGFTVDEPPEALGAALTLPSWLEPRRARIEARLPDVRPPR